MSFGRRQIQRLIDEIRQKNMSLDETYSGILNRWRDDELALDAFRVILARAEKTEGVINESDVVAFIGFVLKLKSYAEETDRDHAKIVQLRREIKRRLQKARALLGKAINKDGMSPQEVFKRMTTLNQIDIEPSPAPLIRSSKNGSRIRTLFMRELSAAVHEDGGGYWMDDQVAAIASIVFECEVHSGQVQKARRS
jgi:hypothetical protein